MTKILYRKVIGNYCVAIADEYPIDGRTDNCLVVLVPADQVAGIKKARLAGNKNAKLTGAKSFRLTLSNEVTDSANADFFASLQEPAIILVPVCGEATPAEREVISDAVHEFWQETTVGMSSIQSSLPH
jgi:hypothetical protein